MTDGDRAVADPQAEDVRHAIPKSGIDHFKKIVAGKQLWNYDNLEPSEKKLVL